MDDATSSENNYISAKSKAFRFYDDFDKYGSPPTAEDGGFVSFNYKFSQKPRLSTFDRINQELAISHEEKDVSGPVTPVTPITPSLDSSDSTTASCGISLTVTDEGLMLHANSELPSSREITIQTSPTKEVSPLIVLPLNLRGKGKSPEQTSMSDTNETNDVHVDSLKVKGLTQRKISLGLTEKLQMLSNLPETPFVTPNSTPFATPVATPLSTPQSSPKAQRKVMAEQHVGSCIVVDKPGKSAVNNYFYRGNFFGASNTIVPNASESLVDGASSLAENTKKMQESSIANVGGDVTSGARKRRPKPSNLREMNFWAPTSM